VLVLLTRRSYDVERTSVRIHIHTKFHEDGFRNSSNGKGVTSTNSESVLVLLMREIS
jgi:hypothetical protein